MTNRALVLLTAVLVLAAACTGDDDGAAPPATGPTSTTLPPPPIEAAECAAPLAGRDRVECFTVVVPADRDDPAGGEVRLAVAALRATASAPEADPIVYFSGGPGGEALSWLRAAERADLGGGRRDVVTFDQRGTGRSTPSLDCPGFEDVVWDLLAADRPGAEETELVHDALAGCAADLRAAGVDLDDFDTPTTADDADDVRRALGYDEWNLFGVSYGTTVALEVTRRHGGAVRSVVLDSVYPPDEPLDPVATAANAQRAIDELDAACEADPDCTVDFGLAVLEVAATWDSDPFRTRVDGRELEITGADVIAGLFAAMYDETLLPLLPDLVGPLRQRGPITDTVVGELARQGVDFLAGFAEGVTATVDCADRQDLPVSGEPVEPRFRFLALVETGACDAWDVESVDPAFHDLAPLPMPVLVLGNQFDPVTPPEGSERVAGAVGGTFVFLPGLGHGAVLADDCPQSIAEAFWAEPDPGAEIDAECTGEMGVDFL